MQQIAPEVYIETAYEGVTLGVIHRKHGLILIDAPFYPEDIRSWRSVLMNMGGGVNPLLINLDVHYDRTIGSRAMDCTIVVHEDVAQVLRDRPISMKSQYLVTGSEWEMYEGIGSIRWSLPEISFSDSMQIYWDDQPVLLEYRPGPAPGAIWVVLPEQGVIFLGDCVLYRQPPFLAEANLTAWIQTLNHLLTSPYRDSILVSGRSGLVTLAIVREQLDYLERIQAKISEMLKRRASPGETEGLIADLMLKMKYSDQYMQRLQHGLKQYYIRALHALNGDA